MLTTVPGLPREWSRMGIFWVLLSLGHDHAPHPHPRGPASPPRCLTLWRVYSSEVPLLSRHNDDQPCMRWPGKRAGPQKPRPNAPDHRTRSFKDMAIQPGPTKTPLTTLLEEGRHGCQRQCQQMHLFGLQEPAREVLFCQTRFSLYPDPELRPPGRPARTHVAQEAAVGCPGLHAAGCHAPPAPRPCDSRCRGQGRGTARPAGRADRSRGRASGVGGRERWEL